MQRPSSRWSKPGTAATTSLASVNAASKAALSPDRTLRTTISVTTTATLPGSGRGAHQPAVLQLEAGIGASGDGGVVGDDDDRGVLGTGQAVEQREDLLARRRVQVAGR